MGKATIRSVAAVLLVVAVLAGSCASGADAQFNITNTCNRTISVITATGNITVPANATVAVTVPPIVFLASGLSVTLSGGTTPPVTIVVPGPIVALIRAFGIFIRSVTVVCVGNCILLFVAIQLPPIPLLPLLSTLPPITLPFGPFCS